MGNESGTCDFGDVCYEELEIIKKRRTRIGARLGCGNKGPPARSSLVGLALSGGGIRSAVTNLGVLQGLARGGILQAVDLLSTVSGGGYIGACLASILSANCQERIESSKSPKGIYEFECKQDPALFTTAWDHFPFRDYPVREGSPKAKSTEPPSSGKKGSQKCSPFTGREEMRHIRTRASYIIPRARPLSSHVIKAVGSVSMTTLMPLLWFLVVITLMTTVYMGVISCVAPDIIRDRGPVTAAIEVEKPQPASSSHADPKTTAGETTDDHENDLMERAKETFRRIWSVAKGPFEGLPGLLYNRWWPIVPVGGFLFGLFVHFFLRAFHDKKKYGEDSESSDERCQLIGISLLTLIFLEIILICSGSVDLKTYHGAKILLPAVFCAAALIGSYILLLVCGTFGCRWHREYRSSINLASGVFFYYLAGALILALLPGFIREGNTLLILVVEAGIVIALRYFLPIKEKPVIEKPSTFSRFISKIEKYLISLLVPVFVVLAVVGVGSCVSEFWLNGNWPGINADGRLVLWGGMAGSFCLLILLSFINFNRISPHYFYRDRLAETFLRTFSMCGNSKQGWKSTLERDATEMPLKLLHGYEKNGDSETDCHQNCAGRGPYLLINATLNLTAARDLKGFQRCSEVFLFSRCFLGSDRTGYVRSDKYDSGNLKLARAMTISGAAVTSVMGTMSSLAISFACTILGVRLGYWLQNPKDFAKKNKSRHWWFWGRWLTCELLNYTHARAKQVYLSDGGHSGDNLGILSLLRRRVKLVIASDAECDINLAFNSLNSSLRQAYVDEGIKVEISLKNFSPDSRGMSKSHFAIGRILYPDRPWQKSWIIIIKNCLTGDELAPILNYKKKSDSFPHETTADQFFTEEQFESYRALGRHASEVAFSKVSHLIHGTKRNKKTESTNPWSVLDEVCQSLQGTKKQLNQCLSARSVLENVCRSLQGKSKYQHRWDDIIQAMWDADQGCFDTWEGFKATVYDYVDYVAELRKEDEHAEDSQAKELIKLSKRLKKHESKLRDLEGREPVPKSSDEFERIFRKIS